MYTASDKPTQVVGIIGRKGAGKDTVANIITTIFAKEEALNLRFPISPKWEIKKYAGKLKQIASLLTGIPIERFEDEEFKKNYMGDEWISRNDKGELYQLTWRQFLQRLGTEAIRDIVHPNTWVNALFADFKEDSKWLITDVRFENEVAAIIANKGITIKVFRPFLARIKGTSYTYYVQKINEEYVTFSSDLKGQRPFANIVTIPETDIDMHPSESTLDTYEADYYIHNNGTIEELEQQVRKILVLEELIQ